MIKISSKDVKVVLAEASSTIKDLVSKHEEISEKLAFYQKKERCEKIAQDMNSKGIYSEKSFDEKMSSLLEKSAEQLDKIEGAVDFQPKLSKVASLDEKIAHAIDPLRKAIELLND